MKRPAAQSTGSAEPTAQVLPLRHDAHEEGSEAPVKGRYVPALQLLHAALLLAPGTSLHVPAGHGWKTMLVSAATVSQKPPTLHDSQAVCRVTSVNLPAGQLEHQLAPLETPKRPVGQAMQLETLDAPGDGRYEPLGHSWGPELPAGQ